MHPNHYTTKEHNKKDERMKKLANFCMRKWVEVVERSMQRGRGRRKGWKHVVRKLTGAASMKTARKDGEGNSADGVEFKDRSSAWKGLEVKIQK